MLHGQLITLGCKETRNTCSAVGENITCDCEVFPSQVHGGDVKHFCKMGHKEIYYSNAKSTGWGGREGRKGKMGTQRAEVFLTAGMFALKGPFKSSGVARGDFLSTAFIATPQIKDFNTPILEICRLK